MSGVHYKFSSKLGYDVVTFHGHSISLADLKRQIMARERLKTPNLAEANAAEEDKIKAMMIQSCRYYEPL
ncbi:hypothetical protein EK904_014169, partial [Melospiza melodia maxima]